VEKWFDVLTIQPLNFDEKLLIFLTLWCFLTLSFDAKNNVSVRESFNWIDCIRNLTRLSRDKRHYWMEKKCSMRIDFIAAATEKLLKNWSHWKTLLDEAMLLCLIRRKRGIKNACQVLNNVNPPIPTPSDPVQTVIEKLE
jgi:hypothetical protein